MVSASAAEGSALITQAGVELIVLGLHGGFARVSSMGVEVIATGARDGSALVSLVGVEVLFEDGTYVIVLEPPAHCGLAKSASGGVDVPVTYVPATAAARGDYAVGPTAPPAESTTWTEFGRTSSEATLTTPTIAAGSTVWIRLRSERSGADPSAWTDPESISV